MKFRVLESRPNFFSRTLEINKIQSLVSAESASIVSIYGRRRVGKSELIAQSLKQNNVIKIEGLQGLDKSEQITRALKQLSYYFEDSDIARLKIDTWFDYFDLFVRKADFSSPFILYLEELQWLANYSAEFISDLKYYWDNYFQYKRGFHVVLCGSSPSFMINEVVNSAALHNRSQHSIHLQPFTLKETKEFLGVKHPNSQILDAYLTLGGIPEYLNYLKNNSSVLISICKNSFIKDSFFTMEYERIFVSSLRDNKNFRLVIEFLAKVKFASRDEILKFLKRSSGGDISLILDELELSGFIRSYAPYSNKDATKLIRYEISDPYLQFYYKFIKPVEEDVMNGKFDSSPSSVLNATEYSIWLGYQFERWCRYNHHLLAKALGFSAIKYRHGAFFSRSTIKEHPGFQWDLVFERNDKVMTLCEVKYNKLPLDIGVIQEFEEKLRKFPEEKLRGRAIEKVLICTNSESNSLREEGYFDRILDLDELLGI